MLIRSQEKESIVNLDNVLILDILMVEKGSEERVIFASIENEDVSMGLYSTPDKAMKVLDKIQNAYCCGAKLYEMPGDEEV